MQAAASEPAEPVAATALAALVDSGADIRSAAAPAVVAVASTEPPRLDVDSTADGCFAATAKQLI